MGGGGGGGDYTTKINYLLYCSLDLSEIFMWDSWCVSSVCVGGGGGGGEEVGGRGGEVKGGGARKPCGGRQSRATQTTDELPALE